MDRITFEKIIKDFEVEYFMPNCYDFANIKEIVQYAPGLLLDNMATKLGLERKLIFNARVKWALVYWEQIHKDGIPTANTLTRMVLNANNPDFEPSQEDLTTANWLIMLAQHYLSLGYAHNNISAGDYAKKMQEFRNDGGHSFRKYLKDDIVNALIKFADEN